MPFSITHWGRAELHRFGWPLLVATVGVALVAAGPWKWLAVVPGVVLAWVLSFFRDPPRRIPEEADAVVSPADGTIAEIAELDHYDFLDGPAVRIGIFLSIFNVHINRAPRAAKVLETHYREGEYLNALNPASAERNESMWIGLEDAERPGLRMAVRQISGAIARRIVCELAPGGEVRRGEKFGMIKFGSRTELVLPAGCEVTVEVGQKVKAGATVVARLGDRGQETGNRGQE